jgi:ribonuclease HII
MVATEPLRKAPPQGQLLTGDEPGLNDPASLSLSVKEIRELLSSLERPDIGLLCRLTRDPRLTVRNMAFKALGRKRGRAANEDIFRVKGVRLVAGADEVGRGALAGPLVAAAALFEPGVEIEGVNDSKLLAPELREELYIEIQARALSLSVVFMDSSLVDRWGLQIVNMSALGQALSGLEPRCDVAVCDHFTLTGLSFPVFGIPTADATFHSVAAASIVAKVERDRVMRAMHRRFPSYNFENNKGYGTSEHWEALDEHGPCELHRLSFRRVADGAAEITLWEAGDEP